MKVIGYYEGKPVHYESFDDDGGRIIYNGNEHTHCGIPIEKMEEAIDVIDHQLEKGYYEKVS